MSQVQTISTSLRPSRTSSATARLNSIACLILDVVVETGNPADSERFLPMLERHIDFYGEAPRQAVADGGYASRANLAAAKARGVADVAFHQEVRHRRCRHGQKPLGVPPAAQLPRWHRGRDLLLQTRLWRRTLPLARVDHFKAYIWSAVVAHNLVVFARLKLA